jgi:catechol 2,3-dioxygenase-like lactoylglutathione lyase family enzyme
MKMKSLDHVNIRTRNVERMTAWYADVLGLVAGDRPPFPFGGAWLYCAGKPIIHLVEVAEQPTGGEPTLEHFAIGAEGLDELIARLDEGKIEYKASVVPGFNITQVNLWDPDGNHLHIDFPPSETRPR